MKDNLFKNKIWVIYVRVSLEKQIKEWNWLESQKVVC